MKLTPNDPRLVLAWIQAWRTRCCPPDTILAGPPTPELERHLRHCPYCRQDRKESMPPVALDIAPEPWEDSRPPMVGDLRILTATFAGWGIKDRYYSPPVVLVTDVPAGHDRVVVIQTYGDRALAGPDDILLDNGFLGFAEPWNRYTVRTADLALSMGRVSDQCAAVLQKRLTGGEHHAPQPGSLLWFFRQVEVETGYHFARQALAGLSPAVGAGQPSLPDLDPSTLEADLRSLPVRIPATGTDDLPEQVLVRTMPADDLLPLAAAGETHKRITILFFTVIKGRIRAVRAIPGTVTLQAMQDGMLQVSGRCDVSPVPDSSRWIFRWQSREWSIEPLPGQYGMAEGVFWAVFPVTDLCEPEKGELVVRVLDFTG